MGVTRVSVGVVLRVAVSSDFEPITVHDQRLFGQIEDGTVIDVFEEF